MRIEFQAPIRTVINDETGELFIVQTSKDIEQDIELARRNFEEKLEVQSESLLATTPEDKVSKFISSERDGFRIRQDAYRKRRQGEVKAIESAGSIKVFGFSLVRPTHGQREQVLEQCAALNPDLGENQFDNVAYRKLLLRTDGTVKLDGVALSVREVNDLDPAIATELANRLNRALHPDPARMLFTLPE